jgi:hypothetical protein
MCGRADPCEMLAIMGTSGFWRREDNAYGQINPALSSYISSLLINFFLLSFNSSKITFQNALSVVSVLLLDYVGTYGFCRPVYV